MQSIAQNLQDLFRPTKVLIVDDEYYSRKVIRTLLTAIGINHIYDAEDGPRGLDAIYAIAPDVVLVDWEMPVMDGAAFVKSVRSPNPFPLPDVPIIMLTGHSERWRVVEAMRLGVNEYLLKPVSSKILLDRMITIVTNPRPIVKVGNYYGPEPRKASPYNPASGEITLVN